MQTKSNSRAVRAQALCNADGVRIGYIERGSPFESRFRFYHHDGGMYDLSARAVRFYLDLMFRGGTPRSRLIRFYKHARRADCLATRYE